MEAEPILLGLVLLSGFYMAWSIGANDVANAMGTSVGSGALTLSKAIWIAAVLEFSGAYFFGARVSETVQNGLIDANIFINTPYTLVYGMLSALIASGIWLQIASYNGWPVSTTHTIVGSIVGFGLVEGGVDAIYWENVGFIVCSWLLSPLCGGIASFFIFSLLRKRIFYSSNPMQSAIKLTPYLVFCVILILSLIMVYQGLQNLDLHLSFMQALIYSLLLAAACAALSIVWLKKIQPIETSLPQIPKFDIETLMQLEKAQKHIQKACVQARAESRYEITLLMGEMAALTDSLKKTEESLNKSSEYALVEKIFGYLQLLSACLMAFAHGANDVANAIGPLSACIEVLTTGSVLLHATVPAWTLALGGAGIVVGLATWGWRVIETIGKKITELTPTRGFSAEFGAALTVLIASRIGMPVSATHTLVGSVVGVGLARGIEALNLRTTRDIVISWIITVPTGAFLTICVYFLIQSIFK